jgi:Tol biopolymer transport system component
MMSVAVADGSAKLLKAVGRDVSLGGVYSPDGRFIAWATKEGIQLYDLRTGTESSLVPDLAKPSVLGWAPDGKHILFSSERGGSSDAWLIAVADGTARGEPILVRKNWGNRPLGFTPSGAFYFGVINNVAEVRVAELDPAGGKAVLPSEPAFRRGHTMDADWSPDGRSLAAKDGRMPGQAVIVRSMDAGVERELPVGEWAIGPGNLRWTPDGKAVVVPASAPGKGNHLIRIDVQTGQVSSLMPLPALGGWPRFGIARDGNEVYYLRPQAGLVSRDLQSGLEREIVKGRAFYWGAPSPDGQKVAIAENSDTSWTLLIRPASEGEFREIVRVDKANDFPYLGSPAWTPDSRHLVFLMRVRGETGKWQLLLAPVEGGEPRRIGLISARQLLGVRLHPDGRRVSISDIKVDLEIWVMENFLPKAKAEK